MIRLLTLGCLLLVWCGSSFVESKEVICYYGTWAVYRPGNGKFSADDIDPFLCTQLVFAFANIGSDGSLIVANDYLTPPIDTVSKFYSLKQRNPALKTIIAVGGWNAGTQNFKNVASNPQLRATFSKNAVAFLQNYHLDGLDIDWEYPDASDRANYVLLLKDLRNAFTPYQYILNVAVAATENTASVGYDIPGLSNYVDFINLMTYDMADKIPGVTNHNAPINAAPTDTAYQAKANVLASIQYWLSKGAPPNKVTLGVPLYGHTFTLSNPAQNGVGAPVKGPGLAGPFSQAAGTLGYNEICVNRWPSKIDTVQLAAYASSGDQWVSYDDTSIVKRKCDLIAQYGLGGGMVWSIETEDFRGLCGPKNPLLTTLMGCVNGNGNPTVPPATTAKPAATTAPPAQTTAKPAATTVQQATSAGQFVCTTDGFFRHPTICTKFYRCVSGTAYLFDCPSGLYFNPVISNCDWPNNVKC